MAEGAASRHGQARVQHREANLGVLGHRLEVGGAKRTSRGGNRRLGGQHGIWLPGFHRAREAIEGHSKASENVRCGRHGTGSANR